MFSFADRQGVSSLPWQTNNGRFALVCGEHGYQLEEVIFTNVLPARNSAPKSLILRQNLPKKIF